MNDTLKMYGSIGSDIMNRYFVVAMCFKRQQRWRRLQTINSVVLPLRMCSLVKKRESVTCIPIYRSKTDGGMSILPEFNAGINQEYQ